MDMIDFKHALRIAESCLEDARHCVACILRSDYKTDEFENMHITLSGFIKNIQDIKGKDND